jgi:hypothetical protein
LNKKEFLEFAHSYLHLNPFDDGKRLYKLLKVKNPSGTKVINVLELIAVLILLSDFGQPNF